MKKRLLCLVLALIMVLPLILTSCKEELTAKQIADANFQAANKALTLSVWLPTDAVIDDKFNERLAKVEEAINAILVSDNTSTKLDIVAINENEYYEKLNERLVAIKEAEKTQGTAYATANKYVNQSVLNPETHIYELAYPPVLDTQLDLFFVGGYSNLLNYMSNNDMYPLNEFYKDGQTYNGLFKNIRGIFMDSMKFNGTYYAIPNNHDFAGEGQYVVVNKELFDNNSDISWDSVQSIYNLKNYIIGVGEKNISGVTPFVGGFYDIPGVIYLDKDNMIASAPLEVNGEIVYNPTVLTDLEEFKSYTAFYKELKELTYVNDTLADGQTAAVQILNATPSEIAELSDDYYVLQTIQPFATIDTVYSSMFAISSHTANPQRAMDVLFLLQTDPTIRTLLQYGIKDVDYSLSVNENGETILVKRNSGYKMNINYTGNAYCTYPDSGIPMSYWDSVKKSNLDLVLHPYLKLNANIETGNISEADAEKLSGYINKLSPIHKNILDSFKGMSAHEFSWIFDAYSEHESLSKFNANVKGAQAQYNKALKSYNSAYEAYLNNPSDGNYKALLDAETELNLRVYNIKKYSTLEPIVTKYTEMFDEMRGNTQDRINLKNLYLALYNAAK